MERASTLARERTLTEISTRKLLSDLLDRVTGKGLRVFTVREWLEHFVKGKAKSRSDKTAARHEQVRDEFVEFRGRGRADLNIAAITSKRISDFRSLRERQELAPATINLDITILSSAFASAMRQGHVTFNPCGALTPLNDTAEPKSVFTQEQVAVLLTVAEGEWKGLILTAFFTGGRLGDCANLRWNNVELVSDFPKIRYKQIKERNREKQEKKEVTVPLNAELEDFLLSLPAPATDEAFLFPSLAVGRKTSPLSKAFRILMKRAKIEQRVIRERGKHGGRNVYALSFHSLRHSFNSILMNAGIPEEGAAAHLDKPLMRT